MAGRASSSKPSDVLARIRGLVRSLVVDICDGRLPLVVLDRYKTYCSDSSGNCYCSSDLPYDCDPYGFDILMTYRFGSMQMAHDAKLMCVPEVRWIGVFPSDQEKYHLPGRCLITLTPAEKKKAEAMLSRCYLNKEAREWRSEMEMMLQKGVKFEIEALSVSSFSFLSEYVLDNVQRQVHI